MPINVVCSHCETRFSQVQDELLGKKMVCPECREIIDVTPAEVQVPGGTLVAGETTPVSNKPPLSRADAPVVKYQSGSITDFLNVLPSESASPVSEPAPAAIIPSDAALVEEDEGVYTDFEVVEDDPAAAPDKKKRKKKKKPAPVPNEPRPLALEDRPAPKELVWSEHVELPAPLAESHNSPVRDANSGHETAAVREFERETPSNETHSISQPADRVLHTEEEPEEAIRPRKKHSGLVLIILIIFVIGGFASFATYRLNNYFKNEPWRILAKAQKEYKERHYEPARKLFEELVRDYPKFEKHAEARFFMELCSVDHSVYSLGDRMDPTASEKLMDKFLTFIEDPAMQEMVAPGRFNHDVWEPALKLTEDIVGKAQDSLKDAKFDEAESWIVRADKSAAVVNRFRDTGGDKESVFDQIKSLRGDIAVAQAKRTYLASIAERLDGDLEDKQIEELRMDVERHGYGNDPEFKALFTKAEQRVQKVAAYKRFAEPIKPVEARALGSTGLLFAPRLDDPNNVKPSRPSGPPGVFFALSRGVLYALDDYYGHILWATRTGIDSDALPVRVPRTDLHDELVLVVVNDGQQSTLTARSVLNGNTWWQQPLPSAIIGQPIQVGQHLYIPLRDPPAAKGSERARRDNSGVILEIETSNGIVTGQIFLGRPLGGDVVRRPGTGQLYIPAEANNVYVFDVEKQDANGVRIDPVSLGVISTGHPADSLRPGAIITTGEGETPGYLILGVADGLDAMKLLAFPLAAPDQPPAIAAGNQPAPINLAGWTWFAPYADSEKLAVVTDRGEFGLFGINQAGNLDAPIFILPPQPLPVGDARSPSRGQVIHADEGNLWFLARGALQHLRIGFDAAHGLKLVVKGEPLTLGQMLHASQVNVRSDGATALAVTQVAGSASCRATAIDLQNGAVRWQRQLGLIAHSNPIRIGDAIVLMDHDGGLYQLDAKPLSAAMINHEEWLTDPEKSWLAAPPLRAVNSAELRRGRDGKSIDAILTHRTQRGLELTIRHYEPGKPYVDRSTLLPAALAGAPLLRANEAIVPLANGLLYRLPYDQSKQLEAGPTWRGEKVPPGALCYLADLNETEFIASDGARVLNRWRWSADEFGKHNNLTLPERVAAAPLILPGEEPRRLIVADVKSTLWMWDADRLGQKTQPLRVWRASETGKIPVGPLSGGPFLEQDDKGNPRILYTIDGVHLVWLSPDEDKPLWVARRHQRIPGDGILGRPYLKGTNLYLTDRTGLYGTLDIKTGELEGEIARVRASAPAAAAVPLDSNTFLAPLSDGTVLLRPMELKKRPRLPVLFLPLPPLGAPLPLPLPVE